MRHGIWFPLFLGVVAPLTACSGFGGLEKVVAVDVTEPGDNILGDTPTGDNGGPAKVGQCDLERRWWTGRVLYEQVGGTPGLSASPSSTLVIRSGGGPDTFYRLNDGARLGNDGIWWTQSPDADWKQRVQVKQVDGGGSIAVIPTAGGSPLLTVQALPGPEPEFEWLRQLRGLLSPDSSRLVQVACWSGSGLGFDLNRVAAWDMASGTATGTTDFEFACGNQWPRPSPAVVIPGGRFLLLSAPGDPRLALVDLDGQDVQFRDILDARQPVEPINEFWPTKEFPILGLAVRPDGSEVAVADHSGRVTRWTIPDLDPVATPLESVVVGINQHTYQPSVESPVAWSTDGQWLAHLGADGEAVVRNADTGAVATVLHRPDAGDLTDLGPATFNPATAFHFLADGSGILMAHEVGITLWRCAGSPDLEVDGDLEVTLAGPDTLVSGQEAKWTATAQSSGQPLVFQLLVDGEEEWLPLANLSGHFTRTYYEPGTFTVRAWVDDGTRAAVSEPLTFQVEPLPK